MATAVSDAQLVSHYPGATAADTSALRRAVVNPATNFVYLDADRAFLGLTPAQKLYAHYFSLASWAAFPIVLEQTTRESVQIYRFLIQLFSSFPLPYIRSHFFLDDESTFVPFQQYAALFFSSGGNYLNFGDSKFLPNIHPSTLDAAIERSASPSLFTAYSAARTAIFSWDGPRRELGYSCSGYYDPCDHPPFTKDVVTEIEKRLQAANISPLNTVVERDPGGTYVVRVASVNPISHDLPAAPAAADAEAAADAGRAREAPADIRVRVQGQKWAQEMGLVCSFLRRAAEHAANDTQREMIAQYIASFESGSIDAHKVASALWVKDVSPAVETYIGFIESYRDPHGVRAEWEGFAAAVNPDLSRVFTALVDHAQTLLDRLPWTAPFHRSKFVRPDFTALDVVSFCTSGVPAGINIPNYDDVRTRDGFKNVYLANVCAATDTSPSAKPFAMTPEEWALIAPHLFRSFMVQVGLHELLGHGSGKLLKQSDLPIPERPDVTTYYEENQTYDAIFGTLSSSLEECRAECVGVYLCSDPMVLDLFGVPADDHANVVKANWTSFLRNGVASLEFYSPDTGLWRQAHACARHAIFRVCFLASSTGVDAVTGARLPEWNRDTPFVSIEGTDDSMLVNVDMSQLEQVGRPAVASLLTALTELKAAANFQAADALFRRLTRPAGQDKDYTFWMTIRESMMRNKRPRREFVQGVTEIVEGKAVLRSFPSSAEGAIQAAVAREREMVAASALELAQSS